MNIIPHVSLAGHSTMRLGGQAAYLCEVVSHEDVNDAVQWAASQKLPLIVIGTGSNIVWKDEGFPGLVIVNKIMGYQQYAEDAENYYLTVGAGEDWDSVVARAVQVGLSGIEALSLIPGTAGATPVQNVGAYGQEIAQTLVSVEAYDLLAKRFVNIPNEQCGFGYRTSRFKTTDRGKFFITGITLHLMNVNPTPPFYPSVQTYLDNQQIHNYTPQIIRDAVIFIRQAKMPDPAKIANNGSFFANPIVSAQEFVQISADHPEIVRWQMEDGRIKLSAAWLVEQAGFKNVHDPETGMATWSDQALVFVNEHATSTVDLLKFKQKIVDAVKAKFNVMLEQEPELLP